MKAFPLVFAAFCIFVSGCAHDDRNAGVQQVDVNVVGYERALLIQVSSGEIKNLGSASWVSSELVITASHLFLNMPEGSQVMVGKSGNLVGAEVVAIDDPAFRDLAMLRIKKAANIQSPMAALDSVPVCERQIQPAQEVVVVSAFAGSLSHSYGSPDYVVRHKGGVWTNHLTGYFPEGTSGGALYEVESGCLAGVISRRHESFAAGAAHIYSTQFITASEINQFVIDHGIELSGKAGSIH